MKAFNPIQRGLIDVKSRTFLGGNSSGDGWIQSLIHSVLSYYSDLISNPFKSGLAYFIAGLVPALIIGWLIFPCAVIFKTAATR